MLKGQNRFTTAQLDISKGLSNNSVNCIYQDTKGFCWFGTNDGLNRYDGYGFKVFRNKFNDSNALLSNRINVIDEDNKGRFWIGTREGLCLYSPATQQFNTVSFLNWQHKQDKINVIVSAILPGPADTRVVATAGQGIILYNGLNGRQVPLLENNRQVGRYLVQCLLRDRRSNDLYAFITGLGLGIYRNNQVEIIDSTQRFAYAMQQDPSGLFWIGTENGLLSYDCRQHRYGKAYTTANSPLEANVITGLYPEKDKMWVLTDGAGYYLYDYAAGTLTRGKEQLSSESLTSLYKDKESRIWIGTLRGGVNILDPNRIAFERVQQSNDHSKGLVSNFILSLYEDRDSSLWIGTDGSGISLWNRRANSFTTLTNTGTPGCLPNNFVTNIIRDKNQQILVATFGGGVSRYNSASRSFQPIPLATPDGEDKNAWVLHNDSRNITWAGTVRNGRLFMAAPGKNRFELYNNYITDVVSLHEDASGVMWAGSFNRIYRLDLARRFQQVYKIDKPARAFLDAGNDCFWIGTEGGGLVLFDKTKGVIRERLTEADGLCNNTVLNILTDREGFLWMSTLNGISRFDPRKKEFRNFYQADGLPSNEFNYNAALALADGRLAFGSIRGITLFQPAQMTGRIFQPPLQLTNILVEGTEHYKAGFPTLEQPGGVQELRLPYDKAAITFDFVALEYSVPGKIQYAYFLEGWDKNWNYTDHRRTGNYSHLGEGTYRLFVKSTNGNGAWGPEKQLLLLVVAPPWYRTWWAYGLYLLAFAGAVYAVHDYRQRQERLKYEVRVAKINAQNERERAEREHRLAEQQREIADSHQLIAENERRISENEKQLAAKEREINEKRFSFFTNIAHEFRTPLTLIINPVEDLLRKYQEEGSDDGDLRTVQRNSKRLLSLVNQLMLFRKAETEAEKLKVAPLNLTELCNEVFLSFQQEARANHISYTFEADEADTEVYLDREKTEITLYNLVSNAFKYTPPGGKITLGVKQQAGTVEVIVRDSGVGFSGEVGKKIFEKFYRAEGDDVSAKPGFGIGLYLVKTFTALQHGQISYQSEPGNGSTFIVAYQKGKDHFSNADLLVQKERAIKPAKAPLAPLQVEPVESPVVSPMPDQLVSSRKNMLITDDDAEIRRYIHEIFRDHYHIQEAENGIEGLRLAKNHPPDVIISDIMMPGMTGLELCEQLKSQPELSHIPILLLTGSSSEEIQLKSAEKGADDYLTKPFSRELLQARVNTLLKNRGQIQQHFYDETTQRLSNLKISEEEKQFMNRCIAVIEDHLADEQFTVEAFAREMGMSHSNLYKKIKALYGYSTNGFIRFVRLRKAAQLFIDTAMNVNEVAFEVGITDVKYFRENFNKQFGLNPSAFIKKYRKALGKGFVLKK